MFSSKLADYNIKRNNEITIEMKPKAMLVITNNEQESTVAEPHLSSNTM